LSAWGQMAESDRYLDACIGFGLKNDWQLGKRPYHADDHAVAQMYLSLYETTRDPAMIAPLIERFDWILANQPDTPLTHDNREHKKRYNWCDALFMAPPVWTRLASLTGKRAYLDYVNKEWWATTDYLYDTEEHLYFRDDRYFEQREANGKKIFWCRGNGWVFGGLVRTLANLPEDYPDRPRYLKIYHEMAAKLLTIQGKDGLWRSSLLDAETYPPPEASGSGFFCYGLAWGVNRGLLDAETYGPAIQKAWQGLVGCVHKNGKLGWVQPIGAAPGVVNADLTEIYGVGSFLLAGTELYKIALKGNDASQLIEARNPVSVFRNQETLSLPAPQDRQRTVLDFKTNRLLTTQVTRDGRMLFQADFAPGETRRFWLLPVTSKRPAPQAKQITFGRFVPERMDDFAWENDRIAFRVYGPALEVETVSPGIDVWVKKVSHPIVDKWYANKDYHKDHGEGADFYKVGPTLGCGGLGLYQDNTLTMSRNFVTSKVIDNGPIRTTFELTFAKWKAGQVTVSETKRISLDLGSNLNRIESHLTSSARKLPLAAGIVKRKGGQVAYDIEGSWMVYDEPAHAKNGTTRCALVMSNPTVPKITEKHVMLTFTADAQKPLVYYTGASWDKSGQFSNAGAWQQYVQDFAQRVSHPIEVTLD
ncbi:MAG: DUF4861 family protein, partial [Phycisphaeraceae bacterium]|nr:DUF4861 family protein [Phycisphaeraceae bacterium]